jgi:ABC-type phosphate transport system substrate-binding protein
MKNLQFLPIIAAGLALAAQGAFASDVKIIANSSVGASDVSAEDLKNIFLSTKTSFGDSHVEPVLEKSGAAHEAFLKDYLGKTDSALGSYYRGLVFTGKGTMPKTLASDAEVVAYVSKTKGAIGYVSGDASAAGVKTLNVK